MVTPSVYDDLLGKIRTESRSGEFAAGIEKGHFAVQVAKPKLRGSLFEIEPFALVQFIFSIGGRHHFHTNLWSDQVHRVVGPRSRIALTRARSPDIPVRSNVSWTKGPGTRSKGARVRGSLRIRISALRPQG